MTFQVSYRPDFSQSSPEEVGAWVEEQFENLIEVLEQGTSVLNLIPQSIVPARYGEGTVCNFLAGTELSGTPIAENGFYVFRSESGLWHKLEEIPHGAI